jgi:hypothetical protein
MGLGRAGFDHAAIVEWNFPEEAHSEETLLRING